MRTDDSILEEERLDADLARYNQIRRKLTDRDTVQDSDSGESSVASSRTSSPPSSNSSRETTNERASSVTNIPTPQTQQESGYTDDRGRNSDNQNRRDNKNPQSRHRDSTLPNVPPPVMPSSTSLQPGYPDFYENFYRQTVDKQFNNYNRNDIGNQRYNDFLNQTNRRYNRNNYQGMENSRQYYPQFYQSDYYPPYVPGNQQTSPFSSQNERKNVQQNPIPSMSQQAVSEPVTTTPSSVDLPPSGTITP